ncbi:MAG: helix-turn-helix domain-containing protein [Polyangiaceae bacterium]
MRSRKAAHNQKIRAALLEAAARLFREHGVAGAGIDAICSRAGLTRGAFYAHFSSKEALLDEVLADMHPLLVRLRRLGGGDRAGLAGQFQAYLDPGNLREVMVGCTLVALTGETARLPEKLRASFGAARERILDEMVRVAGEESDRQLLDAALSLATGAVQTAAADNDADRQRATLESAYRGFLALSGLPNLASA